MQGQICQGLSFEFGGNSSELHGEAKDSCVQMADQISSMIDRCHNPCIWFHPLSPSSSQSKPTIQKTSSSLSIRLPLTFCHTWSCASQIPSSHPICSLSSEFGLSKTHLQSSGRRCLKILIIFFIWDI